MPSDVVKALREMDASDSALGRAGHDLVPHPAGIARRRGAAMTHAENVAREEQVALEVMRRFCDGFCTESELFTENAKLRLMYAETCPTCGGEGRWSAPFMSADGPGMDGEDPCSKCDGGRRRG